MKEKNEEQDLRISANETAIQLINQKLDFISEQIKDIKDLLVSGYVTKVEFSQYCMRVDKLESTNSRILWIILTPIISALVVASALIISKNGL
jgi:hypothetical protein